MKIIAITADESSPYTKEISDSHWKFMCDRMKKQGGFDLNSKRMDCFFYWSKYNRPEEYVSTINIPLFVPSCKLYDGEVAPCETCTKYISKDEVYKMAVEKVENR